jgi:hypothetical protein
LCEGITRIVRSAAIKSSPVSAPATRQTVHSFEAIKERVVELRSRRTILFVGPAHHDLQRIVR